MVVAGIAELVVNMVAAVSSSSILPGLGMIFPNFSAASTKKGE